MKWNELTMSQKQALMKIYVNNGITNLDDIVNHYNSFREGGPKKDSPSFDRKESYNERSKNLLKRKNLDKINPRRPIPSLIRRFDDGGNKDFTLPEVEITPRSSALARSRQAKGPNTNFMYAQDMSLLSKIGATLLPFLVDPHSCLNTNTGFYNPRATVASNPKFVANPEKYGFTEITQKETQPGDLIILSNKDNHPTHAVMFDSVAEDKGIHNNYYYEAGDTLVNYSNGGRNIEDYRLQGPLSRFSHPTMSGGDFSGIKRYYKYIGRGKNTKNKK